MTQPVVDQDLAELIAEASDAFAPSQAELAAEIGVQPLALTTWRRGRSRPTAAHLESMAQALEGRSERLKHLAARLNERAATHGRLTRRPRRVGQDMRTARRLAERMIAAEGSGILRIVFYGSRVRGTASPPSDWDFIVVLRNGLAADVEATAASLKRAALGTDSEGIRLDLWPIEQEEWDTARRLHGHPVRTADREGVVLHAAG